MGSAAVKLIAPEFGTNAAAGYGEGNGLRFAQRNGYRDRRRVQNCQAAYSQALDRQLIREFPRDTSDVRECSDAV